ncbi:hypothetical protein [Conexibacter sp. CPCC 206217]|uniref:hypothetical protein n=1 Tax=Conexibacter sp. CPCC 206217 TaxID=3064574 RepID=UPI002717A7CD|nr:hypothetical protein [Conexibacter sp. CPCC 206217]MDO8209066.1 hypothetical protein [Conexibacter sp. CPCC 206217]
MALDPSDNEDPPAERPPDADPPTRAFDTEAEDESARDAGSDPPPEDEALPGASDESASSDPDDQPTVAATRLPDSDSDDQPTIAAAHVPDSDDDAPAPEHPGTPDPDATEEWSPSDEQHTSDLSPARDPELEALRETEFAVVWRGYDPQAVDTYTASVVRALDRFEERTYPTAAVQRALDRVGEQTAAILRQAEQAADETTRRSRAKADDRVQRAEREAAELQAGAIARVRSLDDDIERLWQERQRLIDATKELADQLRATALDAEARFPPAEQAPPVGPAEAETEAAAPFDAAADPPTREHGAPPVDPLD